MDVNGRPIPIMERYKLKTEMHGNEAKTTWWDVKSNTTTIIGMDNFEKAGTATNPVRNQMKKWTMGNQDEKPKLETKSPS